MSNFNRGNFVVLISLRCRNTTWLKFKINEQLEIHKQWTSPDIQNAGNSSAVGF